MNKKILAGTMAAMMAASSMVATAADKELDVFVNDTEIALDAFEENGKVMVPVRAVCEALDMEVVWNDEAKRVEITKLPTYVTFTPFADGYTFARTAPMMLGTAPQLLGDGVTYVPSEFFGEILPVDCEISDEGIKISVAEVSEETTEEQPVEETVKAKVLVTEITENGAMIYDPERGDVSLNITEETVVTNEAGEKTELAAGKLAEVEYSPAMTMSLPPIANAVSVTVMEAVDYELVETTVKGIEESGILVGEDESSLTLFVKTEDFSAIDAEGNSIEEIAEGSKITAIVSTISTKSLPPQKNVLFIRVVE